MSDISGMTERVESRRDFAPAQRTILALHGAGELNEAALLGFAKDHKYEELVAALSAMAAVKIATLDRLISGDRYDPILIVGKTIGLEWATVRALILLRLGKNRVASPADIEGARVNFARLMPSTAEAGGEVLADPPIGLKRDRHSRAKHFPSPEPARYAAVTGAAQRHREKTKCLMKPTFNRMPTGSATTDTP